MATAPIITRGMGAPGSVALTITHGFAIGAAVAVVFRGRMIHMQRRNQTAQDLVIAMQRANPPVEMERS